MVMQRPHRRLSTFLASVLLGGLSQPALLCAQPGPTIAELVEVADIEALAPSPDGRLVAFRVQRASITANSHVIEWRITDLETGQTRRVADGGGPIYTEGMLEAEPPIWSPDGRYIHHRSLVEGAIGIWRTAVDGSGSSLLVGGDSDVESIAPLPGGRELTFVTGPSREEVSRAERREYDDGILADQSVELGMPAFRSGWVRGRLSTQRLIGRWVERDGLLWRTPRQRHRLDLVTVAEAPTETVPAPTIEPLSQVAARFGQETLLESETGDVASLGRAGSEPRLEVRRRDGQVVACTVSACRTGRIVAMVWRPGREGQLLFTRSDSHYRQSLHLLDSATGQVRDLVQAEGLLSGGRGAYQPCAMTARRAICVAAGPLSPPRLERIDLESGERAILFDPNEALRARPTPRVERLDWRLPNGRLATGTLLIPNGAQASRAPFFVMHYACPGYLRGGPGDDFPLIQLADAGFVVACLNAIQGEPGPDNLGRYRDALSSLDVLIPLLERRNLIDPRRIGMGGFSYGSEVTMWAATNSRHLAAASVSSPQLAPSTYWFRAQRGSDFPQVLRESWGAGLPEEDREHWRRVSPALNVARIAAPVLIQLPEREASHSAELLGRLGNTNTPVELYVFPDEAHVKVQPRHRRAVYRRNLDWFRYWLQGYVDSDPAKAEQYRRWDELRRRQSQPRTDRP